MQRADIKLVWALAFCLTCTSAIADNYAEARRHLERMAASMDSLTYQGTFVYVRGEDVETMRVTHVNDGEGKRERMYAVSGPPREIIRDQDGVRCALGDDSDAPGDPGVTGSLFPEIPVDELAEAGRQYWFKLGGETRIAGHRGTRLSILPRDEYRYGYDLWLEKDSGLLLRWVLYDANRRALAKLMFTDLTIGQGVDLEELESPTPRERFVRLQSPSIGQDIDSKSARGGQPDGVPPGFTLAARSQGPEGEAAGLQHYVFSDGLASVSVYIELLGNAAGMRDGLSRLGTTNAYSMSAGNRKVTSIGEVPPITVKTMTNAFAAPLIAAD